MRIQWGENTYLFQAETRVQDTFIFPFTYENEKIP